MHLLSQRLLAKTKRQIYLCLSLVFLSSPIQAEDDSSTRYKIREGTLASALIQLGRYGGISIIFSAGDVASEFSPRIDGNYTRKEVLDLLLANTNMRAEYIADNVVSIVANPDAKNNTKPATRPIEELTVVGQPMTGSRLGPVDIAGSSPVDVISRPELDISGSYSLGNFLKAIPAVSGNSTSTAVSNGGDGTATVTLRGLPANNTLVLIDGRRMAFNGTKGDAVNLNGIPAAAIERIEILKDGASSIYGADAIAGVVNIILKKEYDGVELEQYYGISGQSDVDTRYSHLLSGKTFDRGSILFSAQHFEQDGLFSRDRVLSANADKSDQGGADLRSSATPHSRIELENGDIVMLDTAQGSSVDGSEASHFRPATDDDLYNYREATSSLSPSKRSSAYLSAQWEILPSIMWESDAAYTHTEATITFAPTPIFTSSEFVTLNISAENQYNPFDYEIENLRRRIVELKPREQKNTAETYRLGTGLKGDTGTIDWSLNAFWNQIEAKEHFTNILHTEKTQRALGPAENCRGILIDACEPLNLFGRAGSIDETQIDYLRTSVKTSGTSQISVLSGTIESKLGSLPAGDVKLVAGAEFRHEAIDSKPDNGNASFVSGSLPSASKGSRRVREAFLESRLPIVNNLTRFGTLDLELSARYSNYSDFGDSLTPKLGVLYRPHESVLLRGTYSEGFRAPNLGELNAGAQQSFVFFVDPCSEENAVEIYEGCAQQSDSSQNQHLTTFEGQPNLKAEDSVSQTIGIVWTPSFLHGLTATVDYFNIEQDNVVDANVNYIVTENAINGSFSEFVDRDESGNIRQLFAPYINIGKRDVSGVDASVRWVNRTVNNGKFSYSFNASYLEKYLDQITPRSEEYDVSGTFVDAASEGNGALPKWKANAGLLWEKQRFLFNYSVNYISRIEEKIPYTEQKRNIAEWITHDTQFSYRFLKNENLKLVIGVDNILDEDAPLVASAFNDSYDARTHDIVGRFFYSKIAYRF